MEFVSIPPALRPHHFSPRVVSSGAGLEKVSLALNGFDTGQASEFQKRSPLSVFLLAWVRFGCKGPNQLNKHEQIYDASYVNKRIHTSKYTYTYM